MLVASHVDLCQNQLSRKPSIPAYLRWVSRTIPSHREEHLEGLSRPHAFCHRGSGRAIRRAFFFPGKVGVGFGVGAGGGQMTRRC